MAIDHERLSDRVESVALAEGGVRIIRHQQVRELASETACSIRDVELAALRGGIAPWRYVRNLGTIGLDGQAKLLQSAVSVVGLGGLGGYVTEALARMGVGRLVLIDGDVFEEHNLNRQLLSGESVLGQVRHSRKMFRDFRVLADLSQ